MVERAYGEFQPAAVARPVKPNAFGRELAMPSLAELRNDARNRAKAMGMTHYAYAQVNITYIGSDNEVISFMLATNATVPIGKRRYTVWYKSSHAGRVGSNGVVEMTYANFFELLASWHIDFDRLRWLDI